MSAWPQPPLSPLLATLDHDGGAHDGGGGGLMSGINTTPLVDVMLVLLIVFLITIPVVSQTVPLRLPRETSLPAPASPGTVVLAVTASGDYHWGTQRYTDLAALITDLQPLAARSPQPPIHIRGDEAVPYEVLARLMNAVQRAGIARVGLITDPAGKRPGAAAGATQGAR